MSDLTGRLVAGKYRVKGRLGGGGVAEVFEAEHEEIGQRFALKVLRREFAAYPEVSERFLIEARAASAVAHPGVVKVFDYGHLEEGEPYLIMELLDGESLIDLLHRRRKLPQDQAVGLCLHILDALDAAHRAGVIHRDLKPENVVLVRGPSGEPWAKLIDFGIARLGADSAAALRRTAQGTIMGTAYYMAPEQARGLASIDGRADLYAVGVMLFEMLTGRLPFEGSTTTEIITRALSEPFPSLRGIDPAIPVAVDDVVRRATARRREERFQSAQEFLRALRPLRPELIAVQLLADESDGDESGAAQDADLETTGMRRLKELAAQLPHFRAGQSTPPRISIAAPSPGSGSRPPTPTFGARATVRKSLTPPPIRRSQPPESPVRNTVVLSRWVVFLGATLGIAAAAAGVGALLVVLSDRGSGPPDASTGGLDAVAVATQPATDPARLRAVAERAAAAAPALLPDPRPPAAARPLDDARGRPLDPARGEQPRDEAFAVVSPALVRPPVPDAMVRLLDLPAGAEATLDGEPVGAEFALEVSDATHTLRVTLRGRKPFVHEFRAAGGLEIPVVLERLRGGAGRGSPDGASPASPGEPAAGPVVESPQPLANPFGDP
ncbi:MAG: protein kinase [Deltaproteobacteria bacterium]|nr:protein kinase [Deltaproteobacteria bacterium]